MQSYRTHIVDVTTVCVRLGGVEHASCGHVAASSPIDRRADTMRAYLWALSLVCKRWATLDPQFRKKDARWRVRGPGLCSQRSCSIAVMFVQRACLRSAPCKHCALCVRHRDTSHDRHFGTLLATEPSRISTRTHESHLEGNASGQMLVAIDVVRALMPAARCPSEGSRSRRI